MQIIATTSSSVAGPTAAAAAATAASGSADASQSTSQASSSGATTTKVPTRLLNPQPTIDPSLGIVVTEYFNSNGQITEQYPTVKALENYRLYGLHGSDQSGAPATDAAS